MKTKKLKQAKVAKNPKNDRVRYGALWAMKDHYGTELAIADLAKRTGMSRAKVIRVAVAVYENLKNYVDQYGTMCVCPYRGIGRTPERPLWVLS